MKTLKLSLKKNLLIVDLPSSIYYWEQNGEFLHFRFKLGNQDKSGAIQVGFNPIKFICKGSELTEEIAREFCQMQEWTFNTAYYRNHNNGNDEFKTAKKSFISAIEAKGFYWLENPVKHPKDFEIVPDSLSWFLEQEIKWKEAEAKTFKNPLIFEIL